MLVISARLAPLPPRRSFMSLLPSEKSYTYLVTACLRNASIRSERQSMRRQDARRSAVDAGEASVRRTGSGSRGGIDGAREGQGLEQERQEEGPEECQGEAGREEGEEGLGSPKRRRVTARPTGSCGRRPQLRLDGCPGGR